MKRPRAKQARRRPRAVPLRRAPAAIKPFSAEYYQRYYLDPRTAVTNTAEMRARACLIASFTAHVGLPVRRILEAGCGTGLLRAQLGKLLPRSHYLGLESSEYLCKRYGWQFGRLEEFRTPQPFDLLICYDVLQYLPREEAARALRNCARLTRGVLYFSALTRGDFQHNCDRSRTDPHVHLRSARWYRQQLQRNFREVGLGLWLRRGAPFTLWELESQ